MKMVSTGSFGDTYWLSKQEVYVNSHRLRGCSFITGMRTKRGWICPGLVSVPRPGMRSVPRPGPCPGLCSVPQGGCSSVSRAGRPVTIRLVVRSRLQLSTCQSVPGQDTEPQLASSGFGSTLHGPLGVNGWMRGLIVKRFEYTISVESAI